MDASEESEKKRLKLIFAVGGVLTVLVTLLLVVLLDGPEPGEAPEPEAYSLTDGDREAVEIVANLFIGEAGTFGVREAAVTPDTILELREQISQSPSSEIFLSHRDVYASLKQNYIAAGSPLDFSSLEDWSDAFLVDNMVTAEVENVAVSVPDDGFYRDDTPMARLTVSFTSVQTARQQTANDTSWDGTYDVLELETPTTLGLVMAKSGGEWRVYAVEDLTYRSLLAIVPDAGVDALPEAEKVGTIKTSFPLPSEQEPTSPAS